ncbi:MAG: DUF1028 domain-containing protein [candidate division WOR-3 bacterium]|nr:DUF1028 domain-containing protein [candidate division WOR-3 bacterium]
MTMLLYFLLTFNLSGTFSIVAIDTITGEYGIAVASKVFDVGYIVPWIKIGAGAVATQALANPFLGPMILEEIEKGTPAEKALEVCLDRDSLKEERQVGVVDWKGNSAAFTGNNTLSWAGHRTGPCFSVQGNILVGKEVIDTMFSTYINSSGPLGERLLLALEAGEAAGGDKRGKQSAALLVMRKKGGYQGVDDRLIDLKVVDNPEPVRELRRQYETWQYYFLAPAYLRLAEEEKDKTDVFFERCFNLLKKALASSINDPYVFNNLAWEFALRKKYPEETLLAAKRAHELAPDDENIMDTLAEAYYAIGDYKQAVYWEERALKKDPKNTFFKKQLEKFKKALKK